LNSIIFNFCLSEWISFSIFNLCLYKCISSSILVFTCLNSIIFNFCLFEWISYEPYTFKFLAFDSCLWSFKSWVSYLFIRSWNWFVCLKWFQSLIRIILFTNVNLFFYSFHYKKSWFSKRFNLTKMSTLTKRMFTLIKSMVLFVDFFD